MTDAPGLAARRGALGLVSGVVEGRRTLADLVAEGALAALQPADRARAQALAATVLRHLGRLDALVDCFVTRPPPAPARGALRLAAAEILEDGVAPHAAVDAAVTLLSEKPRTRRLAGLANAVGRRIAAEGPALWRDLPPEPLPAWIAGPVRKAHGRAALAAITAACRRPAPLDLTPRDPAAAGDLAATLGARLLPTGSLRLERAGQVSALPGHDAGAWWVQDAAAAIPARLLGDVRGLRVLDLCAAPGGKTLQLAAAGAEVTALDVSEARLARLRENLARTGLAAEIVAADARDWSPAAPFDAILLDAPCSATGTLRRHPDLPHARPDPDLRPLLALQAALLDRAAGWLAPGGRLLFCTCSLLPQEGERQAERALAEIPGLARAMPATLPPGVDPAWRTPAGDLRLRPDYWADLGGMDGFFAALFARA